MLRNSRARYPRCRPPVKIAGFAWRTCRPSNRPWHAMTVRLRVVALGVLLIAGVRSAAADGPDFDRSVAPLIMRRCLECHNASDAKGELDLTRQDRALAGGASGAV